MQDFLWERDSRNPFVLEVTKPSVLLIILLLVLSCSSRAALGDNEQSIQRDTARMRGSVRVLSAAPFAIHEIQTTSGYTVREFVSRGGTVFAVSWSGPGGIDLQSLLGAYFEPFKEAVVQRGQRGRGPLLLNTPGLVFEQVGHVRAIQGRAYVPQLLPPNMDPNDIR